MYKRLLSWTGYIIHTTLYSRYESFTKVHIHYRLQYTHMCSWQKACCRLLHQIQPIVIHSRSVDIYIWAYESTYVCCVYELSPIVLIFSGEYWQVLSIDRMDIVVFGGRTEPSLFNYDHMYLGATCIENPAVPLDAVWIFNNCPMSTQQLHVIHMLTL